MSYEKLEIESKKFIFLCGDDSKELLGHAIANEVANHKQKILIVSDAPLKYPIDGHILVDIDSKLLKQKLANEQPFVTYLCNGIENELLLPIDQSFWQNVLKITLPGAHFLVQLSPEADTNLFLKINLKNALLIHSLNFQSLEPTITNVLNDFNSNQTFSHELLKQWQKIINVFCPDPSKIKEAKNLKKILFINQVKSLINENKIIGIFRNLLNLYDGIYIGDVNDLKIREI